MDHLTHYISDIESALDSDSPIWIGKVMQRAIKNMSLSEFHHFLMQLGITYLDQKTKAKNAAMMNDSVLTLVPTSQEIEREEFRTTLSPENKTTYSLK